MVHNNTGGPHGLGDPDDRSLRKVELEVCIPKIIRERTKLYKCPEEVKEFENCCKEKGLMMWYSCQKQNENLKKCQIKWYADEELKKECTEIYLAERAEFRRTGITKKQKEWMKNNPGKPLP
ncbi:COX assembly mitochondrial protein homolog [Culicoides brevitarsis]|uniref:COX assembly mitochondrial protein homolog n=1 Tax=Culicoides brevitarsis TaxID=469753 RepID=UPI00307C61DF